MAVADGLRSTTIDLAAPAVSLAFLLEPPGWTRLEPQSVSGDPTPGLEARVHDPLWLLTRQWQLGEFHGEDVGSPVFVHVATSVADVGGYQPADAAAGRPARAWVPGDLIEAVVQAEPAQTRGPGLRQRAEAGAQLLSELRAAGTGPAALADLVAACPLTLPWADDRDLAAPGLLALFAGRLPDPELAVTAFALDTATPALPAALAGVPDPAGVLSAAVDWFAWYRGGVAPEPAPAADAWIPDRLEHRFAVDVGGPAGDRVLRAPQFGASRVEWHSLDHDAAAPAGGLLAAGPLPAPVPLLRTLLATPLRYSGMPAERYWEFEDAQVNLGALQVQPHDLARLALVEFGLVYGNDWLTVPVDVPYGCYLTVDSVSVTTTFGETVGVPAADDSGRGGGFGMFTTCSVAADGTVGVLPGLFLPPAAPVIASGAPLEEVLFLRDEVANLAWAVERSVTGPSGTTRDRTAEPRPAPFVRATDPGADLDYLLQNDIPDWWIPMVPVSTGYATVALRKGAMVKAGAPVLPRGVLLVPGSPLTVQDEEIPREGVRVRRVPALGRRADGSYVRWITRQVSVGRGEGASGLEFDSAIRRATPPA